MEVVPVDLDIASKNKVCWGDELLILVDILVLTTFKEFTLDNTRILLSWFIDWDRVVREEERYNEAAVNIFWDTGIEFSSEAEDFALVVYCFEEVFFGLLWNESVNVSERVNLISETIMGRNLSFSRVSWFRVLNLTEIENFSILVLIEVKCELIDSSYVELTAIWFNKAIG